MSKVPESTVSHPDVGSTKPDLSSMINFNRIMLPNRSKPCTRMDASIQTLGPPEPSAINFNEDDCKPSHYGVFKELPLEVRWNVWGYLMPELREEDEPQPQPFGSPIVSIPRLGNRFAILRTSRALRDEVCTELYRHRTLSISIRPERRGWRAEDLPGSTMTDFVNTNFFRFEKVSVYIYAPHHEDLGQIFYARAAIWNFVRVLMGYRDAIEECEPYSMRDDRSLLDPTSSPSNSKRPEPCTKLDVLEISFIDTLADTWSNTILRRTHQSPILDGVYMLVGPFGYLRNARKISFLPPVGCKWNVGLQRCIARITKAISEGFSRDEERVFVTNEINTIEGLDFSDLDVILDRTPGHAAAILRRERLIHYWWYWPMMERLLRFPIRDTYDWLRRKSDLCCDFSRLDLYWERHGAWLQATQNTTFLEDWRAFWPDGIVYTLPALQQHYLSNRHWRRLPRPRPVRDLPAEPQATSVPLYPVDVQPAVRLPPSQNRPVVRLPPAGIYIGGPVVRLPPATAYLNKPHPRSNRS